MLSWLKDYKAVVSSMVLLSRFVVWHFCIVGPICLLVCPIVLRVEDA